MNEEKEILTEAIGKIRETIAIEVDYLPNTQNNPRYDGMVNFKYGGMEWEFFVEIKRYLNEVNVGILIKNFQNDMDKLIIVTEYIFPTIAAEFREKGIQYIDTAGNIYINQLPLYIERTGRKPKEIPKRKKMKRFLKPAGMQLVYTLLCNPGIENLPYRKLAEKADVANGTVGWVMNDLKELGYLLDKKNERRLIKKDELLMRWVEEYPLQLKSKNLIGRYTTEKTNWWKEAQTDYPDITWGGEVAANILTDFLRPQNKTIYVKGNAHNILIAKYKLRKDEEGEIEIVNKFWNFKEEERYKVKGIVNPILVYADLIATGDTRNIKIAEEIFEDEIKRYL
ncbi:MAG: type IV toxin-antitoxin system AbiEi family antitoxin [Melioribacteraceae bacterium]|nr:type IV toxin-antitoxin system AbiEi family antitoxin [Melioribacteraceae bacterium]